MPGGGGGAGGEERSGRTIVDYSVADQWDLVLPGVKIPETQLCGTYAVFTLGIQGLTY